MPTTLSAPTAVELQQLPAAWTLTESLTVAVDGEAEAVRAGLERGDLAYRVARTLDALGAARRLTIPPVQSSGCSVSIVLAFDCELDRLPGTPASHPITVCWTIDVLPSTVEGSYVSVTMRFAAADDAGRERLLDGWLVVRTASHALLRRAIAAASERAAEGGSEAA